MWEKFYIGMDAETKDILCCELKDNNKGNAEVAQQMLKRLSCKVKSSRSGRAHSAA